MQSDEKNDETRKERVVIIVQARMGSTRLPGKLMKEVLGKPLFFYQLERLKKTSLADRIVIATTEEVLDDQVVAWCRSAGIPCFRGSAKDVLDRYYQAAKQYRADVVVRITADCPLIDPGVVDQVIHYYLDHQSEYDYLSNTYRRTFPRGLDVEIFSFEALQKVAECAKAPEEREHVTLHMHRNPKEFRLGHFIREKDESNHRWTVDTYEDYLLIKKMIEALYPENPVFGLENMLELFKKHPEWKEINAHIEQKGSSDVPL